MKLIYALAAAVVLAGVLVVALSVANVGFGDIRKQDELVQELEEKLASQGLPATSIQVTSRFPFRLSVDLLTTGDGREPTEADLENVRDVQREVVLASRRVGVTVMVLRVTVLDRAGALVYLEEQGGLSEESVSVER